MSASESLGWSDHGPRLVPGCVWPFGTLYGKGSLVTERCEKCNKSRTFAHGGGDEKTFLEVFVVVFNKCYEFHWFFWVEGIVFDDLWE